MSGHISSLRMYFTIFGLLMVLTVVTVAVTYVHLGEFNLAAALAIAITKAFLVIYYFMHMKYSPKLFKVTLGCSFFFLMIMFVITMSDYLSRPTHGMPAFPPAAATGSASVATPPLHAPEHAGTEPGATPAPAH
jgi:cytochrome c oxidase subunit IV